MPPFGSLLKPSQSSDTSNGSSNDQERPLTAASVPSSQNDNGHPVTAARDSGNLTLSPIDLGAQSGEAVGSGSKGWNISGMLQDNPYFSAGFGLMGLGAGLAILRRSSIQLASLAQRRLLVTLEISSKDQSYLWFLKWMSSQAHPPPGVPTSSTASIGKGLTAWGSSGSTLRTHQLAVETTHEQRPDGTSQTAFSLVPGPGTHYFKYKRAWFQVKRERDGKMMDLTSGTPWETVTLTTLSRDRSLFPQLLSEARELARASEIGRTVIYTAWGPEWRPFGQPRRRRLLDSVVLDRGVKERIVDDVKDFMGRGTWYAERGIPYRRGYLLHGPPGSGKSSFIQALAGSLEYNICVLNLSERGLTDDKLNHLLANAPERSIILLEDVDAAFAGREQSGEPGFRSNVTFSGLLNALDGVASSTSQRILFMTTNHISRLDPALIRPGRADIKELIDDATPHQAGELFEKFYRDSVEEARMSEMKGQVEGVIRSNLEKGKRLSMASLQGHFIRHGRSADEALADLEELVRLAAARGHEEKLVIPSMPS